MGIIRVTQSLPSRRDDKSQHNFPARSVSNAHFPHHFSSIFPPPLSSAPRRHILKPVFLTDMPPQSFPLTVAPQTQRLAIRAALAILGLFILRALFSSSKSPEEIQSHGVLERVYSTDKYLDVSKYQFLQSRLGRDDRTSMFDEEVKEGMLDFWSRYQKPFITGKSSAHLDTHP